MLSYDFILVTEEFAIVSGTVSLPHYLSSVPEQVTATGPTRVRLSFLASCHMSKKKACLYVHMRLRGNRAMIAPDLGTALSSLTVSYKAHYEPGYLNQQRAPAGLHYLYQLSHIEMLTVTFGHFPHSHHSFFSLRTDWKFEKCQ